MMDIYLAIWHDRHTDDQYEAFRKLENAVTWCKEGAETYRNYEFSEDSDILDEEWLFYLRSDSDDGPSLYVRKIELF